MSKHKESRPADRLDLPQGTPELLILRTLALEPRHGWAISERIRQMSRDVLRVRQGSLYPALHRLERRGWISATWGTSEHNRRAGMRWTVAGANAITALRCCILSGRFEDFWERRAAKAA